VLRDRDADAAEADAREAVSILKRLIEADRSQVQYQDDLALCTNNLAALAGHRQQWSAAIGWHKEAISLEEQLARKAPAVVRYRSDLATTLNNLGVIYCRAGQSDEADASFKRARELFKTLADDYPEEMAFRGSLAALLNNQALALAGAARHQDALIVYQEAIELEQSCLARLPDSAAIREALSKMYYNDGQSLRSAGNIADSIAVALKRRELWPDDGQRLLGVASELAEIAQQQRDGSLNSGADSALKDLDDEVLATLSLAQAAGWPKGVDLAGDARFGRYRLDQRFADLMASLKLVESETDHAAGMSRPPSSSSNSN